MIESSFRISGPDASEVNREVCRCSFCDKSQEQSPNSSRIHRDGLSELISVTNALKYVIR